MIRCSLNAVSCLKHKAAPSKISIAKFWGMYHICQMRLCRPGYPAWPPLVFIGEEVQRRKPKSSEARLPSFPKVVESRLRKKHIQREVTESKKTYQDPWQVLMFSDPREERRRMILHRIRSRWGTAKPLMCLFDGASAD